MLQHLASKRIYGQYGRAANFNNRKQIGGNYIALKLAFLGSFKSSEGISQFHFERWIWYVAGMGSFLIGKMTVPWRAIYNKAQLNVVRRKPAILTWSWISPSSTSKKCSSFCFCLRLSRKTAVLRRDWRARRCYWDRFLFWRSLLMREMRSLASISRVICTSSTSFSLSCPLSMCWRLARFSNWIS